MELEKAKNLTDSIEKAVERLKDILAKKAEVSGKLSVEKMDENQVANYELAWAAAIVFAAKEMLSYPEKVGKGEGDLEGKLSRFFIADALDDLCTRLQANLLELGLPANEVQETLPLAELSEYVRVNRSEPFAKEIAQEIADSNNYGAYGLNEEQQMMMESFRSFAEDQVMPKAEEVHRKDLIVPEEIISGLSEMGCFGLSIPDTYGGFHSEEAPDNTSMAVVTEELSRGSVGIAGSLITRPEIVSKAILAGGTTEQKEKWLPLFASGEKLCAVAVTEPDYGSNVAGIKVAATKVDGGYKINGVKTWCTFAGRAEVLMVLVRTNPDMALKHKGLSILLAEKPQFLGHDFEHTQDAGGKISGRAIPTLGYRGMHSFEVVFEDYFVPDDNLVGGESGLGKGFYLQMEGFAGGRLQTAARAAGVMQSATEKALQYSMERKVFDKPVFDYGLTQYKVAKMAAITQAVRQMTYKSAELIDKGEGMMEASLVKFYSCRIAEWVTREALQIHGGMGYAEEYEVSRLFVDARVFSIFEGAEELLALRVIARSILTETLQKVPA